MFVIKKQVSLDRSGGVFVWAGRRSHHANDPPYVSVRFFKIIQLNVFESIRKSSSKLRFGDDCRRFFVCLASYFVILCSTEFMASSRSRRRIRVCLGCARCAATSAFCKYVFFIFKSKSYEVWQNITFLVMFHRFWVVSRSILNVVKLSDGHRKSRHVPDGLAWSETRTSRHLARSSLPRFRTYFSKWYFFADERFESKFPGRILVEFVHKIS